MRIDMTSNAQEDDTDRISFWQMITFGCGTPEDRANNRRFTYWCIAWALAIIGATFVVETFENLPSVAAWLIAISPNVLALFALSSYLHFLRMTDELQRRIQVEGLAIGFGIGWIFAIGYIVLQSAGAPELSTTTMVLVLTAGWIIGNVRAIRLYR